MDLVSIGVAGMTRFGISLNDMRFSVSELLVEVAEVVLMGEVVGSLNLMGVVTRGGWAVEGLDSEVVEGLSSAVFVRDGAGVLVSEEEEMG